MGGDERDWIEGLRYEDKFPDIATGDDPVLCHLCGKDTSLAMITLHLETEHGIDPAEIANAPVIDRTDALDSGPT